MFEQSVLTFGPPTKRVWTTCLGMTGQMVLVSCMVVAPMIFPQVLPMARLVTELVPPVPPPPPPPGERAVRPRAVAVVPQTASKLGRLVAPAVIPERAQTIIDPEPEYSGIGVQGGVPGGERGGIEGGILGSILTASTPVAPPVSAPVVSTAPPRPVVTAAPPRVREGGLVHPAVPIYRPDPKYPAIATQTHTQGLVTIEGVIGIDGHIRELKVLSGSPLLINAAMDAVRQWRYQPSHLNGEPVEVVIVIAVTFRLS